MAVLFLMVTGLGFTAAALFTAAFVVALTLPVFAAGENVAVLSRDVAAFNLLLFPAEMAAEDPDAAEIFAFGAACFAVVTV